MDALTDLDRAVLDIAGRRFHHWGAREAVVRAELGLSMTAYAQRLNALLDNPAAYVAEPMLVKRLRRVRDEARARRRHPAGRLLG